MNPPTNVGKHGIDFLIESGEVVVIKQSNFCNRFIINGIDSFNSLTEAIDALVEKYGPIVDWEQRTR